MRDKHAEIVAFSVRCREAGWVPPINLMRDLKPDTPWASTAERRAFRETYVAFFETLQASQAIQARRHAEQALARQNKRRPHTMCTPD